MRNLSVGELENVGGGGGGGAGSTGAGAAQAGAGAAAVAGSMTTTCTQVPRVVKAAGATLYDYSNTLTVCTH